MKTTAAVARGLLPERPKSSHKGDFGHLLIVAGSRGMGGAAALAALGAVRSGAGLVTAAVPASVQPGVAAVVPEALTKDLPERDGALAPSAASALRALLRSGAYTALAIGPGLSRKPGAAVAFFAAVTSAEDLPLVVDADGLNLLAAQKERAARLLKARRERAVLTPHPGEAARLLGTTTAAVQKDREGSARRIAERYGVVCLLKGQGTVVTDGDALSVNPTGNPGMAKGGMGDVLTGLIGGLLAQYGAAARRGRPVEYCVPGGAAAVAGAYIHGLAGDLAVKRSGRAALTARDVAGQIAAAVRRLER